MILRGLVIAEEILYTNTTEFVCLNPDNGKKSRQSKFLAWQVS